METIDNSNIMYFNNDEDFYRFCVVPEVVITKETDANGNVHDVFTFNLSDMYNSCLKDGKKFIIKDENSQIFKHKAVSYRSITKPIENLEPYFRFEI